MKISYENDEVVIRIPAGAAAIKGAPLSKSEKNKMLASTNGFVQVQGAPAGVKLGLNLIGPKE